LDIAGVISQLVEVEDPFMHMNMSGRRPGEWTDMDVESLVSDVIDAAESEGRKIGVFGKFENRNRGIEIRAQRTVSGGVLYSKSWIIKIEAWAPPYITASVPTFNPERYAMVKVLSAHGFISAQTGVMYRPYYLDTVESVDKLVEVEDPFMHMDLSGPGPGREPAQVPFIMPMHNLNIEALYNDLHDIFRNLGNVHGMWDVDDNWDSDGRLEFYALPNTIVYKVVVYTSSEYGMIRAGIRMPTENSPDEDVRKFKGWKEEIQDTLRSYGFDFIVDPPGGLGNVLRRPHILPSTESVDELVERSEDPFMQMDLGDGKTGKDKTPDKTVQIDGDFGDPWYSGGDWWVPPSVEDLSPTYLGKVYHFDGLEVWDETESEYYDTSDPEEQYPVYSFEVWSDETPESEGIPVDSVIRVWGMGRHEWESMSTPRQWVMVAGWKGFYEFDMDPKEYSKAELGAKLGVTL